MSSTGLTWSSHRFHQYSRATSQRCSAMSRFWNAGQWDHVLWFLCFPACRWQCCEKILLLADPSSYIKLKTKSLPHFNIRGIDGNADLQSGLFLLPAVFFVMLFTVWIISYRGRIDISNTTLPASKVHDEEGNIWKSPNSSKICFCCPPALLTLNRFRQCISPVTDAGEHFWENNKHLTLFTCWEALREN